MLSKKELKPISNNANWKANKMKNSENCLSLI